jgi:hypothetical protein
MLQMLSTYFKTRQQKIRNTLQLCVQRTPRIFRWLIRLILWIASCGFRYLRWAAFVSKDEQRVFSKNRLIKSLVFTALLIFCVHLAFSAAYFYGTQFEEIVYTTGKQEVVTGELYQFTGCTSLPCSTETGNGKFYEIEHSLYLPYLIYPEEDVFANIPQQDGACFAKGYGLYSKELKFLHRRMQWYQKVYGISCRPYTNTEKTQAIESGKIPEPADLRVD